MTTLDYVDIPAGVTRLRSSSPASLKSRSSSPSQSTSSDLRPASRIYTSLPHPSPPGSPTTAGHARQMSFSASALTSPTLSFIPQLLLSSAIPGGTGNSGGEDGGSLPTSPTNSASSPRQATFPSSSSNGPGAANKPVTLLSNKDPLSLPIMSNNFRRFVSKVGPVFWLQDRVEEIMLWKRGWRRTVTWMAVYAWLCYFPRMVLLIPHAVVIGAILATYPYGGKEQGGAATPAAPSQPLSAAAEGSAPWQANIQAIQNLMGAVSDLFTLAEPHVHHFALSPAHFKEPTSTYTKPGASSSAKPTTSTATSTNGSNTPVSPYTLHILVILTLTFPLLAFIVHMPYFPIRQVFLFGGLLPFVFTHPWVGKLLAVAGPYSHVIYTALYKHGIELNNAVRGFLGIRKSKRRVFEDNEAELGGVEGGSSKIKKRQPLKVVIRRLMDDDRLTDKCWNSEMREVELWENERFTDPNATTSSTSNGNTNSNPHSLSLSRGQWSKTNLRPTERSAWTRGRDGWSGVGAGALSTSGNAGADANAGGVSDGQGEVSSNLTFSLAPGWLFVETEDWRKDLVGAWSGVGADPDGWVYTNDAWLGARPEPYTAAGGLGSVTRRRRWVRRVWYDKDRAEKEK